MQINSQMEEAFFILFLLRQRSRYRFYWVCMWTCSALLSIKAQYLKTGTGCIYTLKTVQGDISCVVTLSFLSKNKLKPSAGYTETSTTV